MKEKNIRLHSPKCWGKFMARVSAPGKLMLSGEWSVLEKGAPCIVLAIEKRVYAEAGEAKEYYVKLKDFGVETKASVEGVKISFEKDSEKLLFTKHAVETALKYVQAKGLIIKKFSLETSSDISVVEFNGKKMKVGFGSSAAAVVAIIGAVLKLHNIGIETEQAKEKLFKLAIMAHFYAQGKIGSGFDVAASTFGGALYYKRFDAEWLENEIRKKPIVEMAEWKWPALEHRNILLPENFNLMIGFTGKSASTPELVKKVREFKKEKNAEYNGIIEAIKAVTEQLVSALEESNEKKILNLIEENAGLLKRLSDESGVELEIAEHRKMSEIASRLGAAAKFSGAGGGDCSVGICFDSGIKEKVTNEWRKNGLIPVDAEIAKEGVRTL